jgi:ABC-type multidrug transport system fused ATPase/permease subunit
MRKLFDKIKSHSFSEMLKEFAWLGRYTRQYKAEVLWYVIVGVLGTVLSLTGSILSKNIIDAVTGVDNGVNRYVVEPGNVNGNGCQFR